MQRWPLTPSGNAIGVGFAILVLIVVFSFLGAIPWEPRGSVAALKIDVQRELTEIKRDVRQILWMLQNGRRNQGDE